MIKGLRNYYVVYDNRNRIVQVFPGQAATLAFLRKRFSVHLTTTDFAAPDVQRYFRDLRLERHKVRDNSLDVYFKVYNLSGNLELVTPVWENAVDRLSQVTNGLVNYTDYISMNSNSLIKIVQL